MSTQGAIFPKMSVPLLLPLWPIPEPAELARSELARGAARAGRPGPAGVARGGRRPRRGRTRLRLRGRGDERLPRAQRSVGDGPGAQRPVALDRAEHEPNGLTTMTKSNYQETEHETTTEHERTDYRGQPTRCYGV